MSEKPILFSAPMVRALLAGTKTQTRRVVKPQPERREIADVGNMLGFKKRQGDGFWLWPNARERILAECPYGQPGDRLWVRETCRAEELPDGLDGVRYVADDHFEPIRATKDAADLWVAMHHYRGGNGGGLIGPTVPPIHMPRWASRITLEITGVRVERLQDISTDDAYNEGTAEWAAEATRNGNKWSNIVRAYQGLWESINGPGSWDANPFVWVVEFKRAAALTKPEGGA